MKYIPVFIALILSVNISAQNWCTTDQSEKFMERIRANQKQINNPLLHKNDELRFVPIQFFLVADFDGEVRPSVSSVNNALCIMNERFIDTDLRFYSAGMQEVNNTNINEESRSNFARNAMRELRNPAALNMFIVKSAGGGAAGFYSPFDDWVVVNRASLADAQYTVEHEVGHFFSLAHTHTGWEGNIANNDPNIPSTFWDDGFDQCMYGDTVTVLFVQSNQTGGSVAVELVDGSNCTTAGDRICDTPPDYGFGQACNTNGCDMSVVRSSCCQMTYDVWDRNGDKIEPMMNNIMSYSGGCGLYEFSPLQVVAMVADFDSPARSYLRNNNVSEYTPITQSTNLTAPQAGEVVDNFNGVLFSWDPTPNATHYRLEIIKGGEKQEFITNDTEFFATNLEANSLYIWTVTATNVFGNGCAETQGRAFQTGDGATSVNEINQVSSFQVYPNPVTQGQDLIIIIESENGFDATLNLVDITGREVYRNSSKINTGKNLLKIPVTGLSTGIHILEIETSQGIISEKILIK